MSPQFVDFNGDGQVDMLTATFDGSPHIAYGSTEGWEKPVRLLDAKGERILIASIWNYETRKHETLGRALDTETPPQERCVSALAFDWDGDGDYDLLLGSYENGHLYRQMNEGTNAKPMFTGKNIVVMAGEQPFAIAGKMTSPRLVDWDNDGDLDLLAGSFGDTWAQAPGGGVFLFRNLGKKGQPAFAAAETLIPVSKKGQGVPTRPDAGLYVDAADYDGDGDLDLVVGGYSMWLPKARELTAAEQATVKQLTEQKATLGKERLALSRRINKEILTATEGMERGSAATRAKGSAIRATYKKITGPAAQRFASVHKKLTALVPGPKREAFVWLYERK